MQGVEFAVNHYGRVLIGDEMGVGKSIQALAIAYIYITEWPLLILTPSSLKLVWKDEIQKWLPMVPAGQIEVIKGSKNAFSTQSKIFIMSYDLAKNVKGILETKKFNIAIADETHYLKSRDSKRSKILTPILSKCTRVILLSGTPMLARPQEVFNIANILRPDLFTKFYEFGRRYCDPKIGPFGIDYSGSDHPDELHLILSNLIMIRRLKADVLTELPKKRRQKIDIEADPKITKEIKELLGKFDEKVVEATLNKSDNIFSADQSIEFQEQSLDRNKKSLEQDTRVAVMKSYTLTGQAKIKGILDFANTLLDNQIKFIIFAQHLVVLDQLEECMKKHNVLYIRIDGSVPPTKRHDFVKEFQENETCRAALLSITASSQGITLTSASTVVFAEFAWTPGLMDQAEDRAHRISQKNAVNIYYLYAENTLDSIIYRIIKRKNEIIGEALDGKLINYELEKGDQDKVAEDFKAKGEIKHKTRSGTLFNYFKFVDKKSIPKTEPEEKNAENSPIISDSLVKELFEELEDEKKSEPKKSQESNKNSELFMELDDKEKTEIASLFNWENESEEISDFSESGELRKSSVLDQHSEIQEISQKLSEKKPYN